MGYVYLIESNLNDEILYKIGFSKNVEKRIKQLSTGNPGDLKLIKSYQTKWGRLAETNVHRHYDFKKIKGEWFKLDGDDIEKFDNICKKVEGNIDALKDNYYFKKRYKL